MAKIVVNKNFNNKYVSKAYELLFRPDNTIGDTTVRSRYYSSVGHGGWTTTTATVGRYVQNDLNSSVEGSEYQGSTQSFDNNYFLCGESMLNLIDKINTLFVNGTQPNIRRFDNTDSQVPIIMKVLTPALFNMDKTIRDNAVDYFVTTSVITEAEGNNIKTLLSPLVEFGPNDSNIDTVDNVNIECNTENNISNINLNRILKVREGYLAENNTNGETMYILSIPFTDIKFNKNGYNTVSLHSYVYSDTGNYQFVYGDYKYSYGFIDIPKQNGVEVVEQIPYVALSIGEVGSGSDIEYDHVDEIEYIDSISFDINLPKEYV
jgi:hypothetical protein